MLGDLERFWYGAVATEWPYWKQGRAGGVEIGRIAVRKRRCAEELLPVFSLYRLGKGKGMRKNRCSTLVQHTRKIGAAHSIFCSTLTAAQHTIPLRKGSSVLHAADQLSVPSVLHRV